MRENFFAGCNIRFNAGVATGLIAGKMQLSRDLLEWQGWPACEIWGAGGSTGEEGVGTLRENTPVAGSFYQIPSRKTP
jgi:hypothetical protein